VTRLAPLWALGLAACAYNVVSGSAPFGARRIAVVPFVEDEPIGLSADLAAALAERLANDGVQVVSDRELADGVLTGRVVSASTQRSPAVGSQTAVPAYDVTTRVEAVLNRGDRVVWRAALSLREDFLASQTGTDTQILATEANRRRALHRIVEQLARELHQRLVLASTLDGEA
jgi:outer membrane lipopolysaccharide assembly protein LptE/RlpB